MVYQNLDFDDLDHQRDIILDEVGYAKKHNSTSIPLGMTECAALAMLLRELGEIVMHAPGGNQFLIDEANRWATVFSAPEIG